MFCEYTILIPFTSSARAKCTCSILLLSGEIFEALKFCKLASKWMNFVG